MPRTPIAADRITTCNSSEESKKDLRGRSPLISCSTADRHGPAHAVRNYLQISHTHAYALGSQHSLPLVPLAARCVTAVAIQIKGV
jgi:hypothetical protein